MAALKFQEQPVDFKIEKGIPLPVRAPLPKWREFFTRLQPGDSFEVPDEVQRKRAITAGKRIGIALISRKENGSGFRIWRKLEAPAVTPAIELNGATSNDDLVHRRAPLSGTGENTDK